LTKSLPATSLWEKSVKKIKRAVIIAPRKIWEKRISPIII